MRVTVTRTCSRQRCTMLQQKFQLSSVFMASVWATIAIFLTFLHSATIAEEIHTSTFITKTHLDQCMRNLLAADTDKNLELSTNEFLTFVSLQSDARIDVSSIRTMPLKLVMNYYFIACRCAETEGADSGCCIGDKAHVNIEEDDTYFVSFCSEIQHAIHSILPATDSPTMEPVTVTDSPTTTPVTVTAIPTFLQSIPPVGTNIPTKAPVTDTPTLSPTLDPDADGCVQFIYGIENTSGLNKDDLENEYNNTIKTRLKIATEMVTIDFLNETFPGGDATANTMGNAPPLAKSMYSNGLLQVKGHRQRHFQDRRHLTNNVEEANGVLQVKGHRQRYSHHGRHLTNNVEEATLYAIIDLLGESFRTEIQEETSAWKSESALELSHTPLQAKYSVPILSVHGNVRHTVADRRLVFYTPEVPVEIRFQMNPLCNMANENVSLSCIFVITDVCVLPGPEEDLEMIEAALSDGLEFAITNGDLNKYVND